ncbi:hypothetical protein AB0M22_09235 [Nocardia sp. NPDC051756]|uniref:hypothetical protein n=1 Tax=Nocardia sp. NPDC051756 TaxID=3154751 RepID=UPI00342D8EC3
MTSKSDLVIAHEETECACPPVDKSQDCTVEINVGDHIGYLDSDPDPEVYTAVPYCRPCWELVPADA